MVHQYLMAFSLTKTYGILPPVPLSRRGLISAVSAVAEDGLALVLFASRTI